MCEIFCCKFDFSMTKYQFLAGRLTEFWIHCLTVIYHGFYAISRAVSQETALVHVLGD